MNSIMLHMLAMLAIGAMMSDAFAGKPAHSRSGGKSLVQRQVTRTAYEEIPYEEVPLDALSPGDDVCGANICDTCQPCDVWSSGFEFTFLKPHFEGNVAFTTTQSDDVSFEDLTETEFDYDLELSPRIWVQYDHGDGLGLRAQYWQFDHAAAVETASPPANGFGSIEPPAFDDVDLSTTIPTDTFTASSSLNAYTIDLEATKRVEFCSWWLGFSSGIRYAFIDQTYQAQLSNVDRLVQGEIDFFHRFSGVGPTVSLYAARCYGYSFTLFGMARGALLYGDGESRLNAGEDLDLADAFFTRQTTSREDLLPMGEMQIGLDWSPSTCGPWQPFFSVALEGQLWSGAGNASSDEGDLGFFGFNVGVGAAH